MLVFQKKQHKLDKTLTSEKSSAEVVKIMCDSRISLTFHSIVKMKIPHSTKISCGNITANLDPLQDIARQ